MKKSLKHWLISISLVLSRDLCFGQTLNATSDDVLNEIAKNDIEDYYLGCVTCISPNRLKADSFFNKQPLDSAIKFSQHESLTVKYYSFLRILVLNDSLAFNFLEKHIQDTTIVFIMSSCLNQSLKFNELISREYKRYVECQAKGYYYVLDNRVYMFQKSDRKEGKAKLKTLKEFLKLHGLASE